jgi:SagB-type dehydrogenase family enzyme
LTQEREYRKITLQELSNILFYACGEVKKGALSKESKRIQPSAGARYPIEAYILNFEKGDLDIKCYHYNVQNHYLEELWDIPITSRKDISLYFGYEWSINASAAIILTGVVRRTIRKYGERGYKYMYLEAGAVLNNLQNNCMLEGIGSVIMGATNEQEVEKLLDLDGENETVILGLLLG